MAGGDGLVPVAGSYYRTLPIGRRLRMGRWTEPHFLRVPCHPPAYSDLGRSTRPFPAAALVKKPAFPGFGGTNATPLGAVGAGRVRTEPVLGGVLAAPPSAGRGCGGRSLGSRGSPSPTLSQPLCPALGTPPSISSGGSFGMELPCQFKTSGYLLHDPETLWKDLEEKKKGRQC